MTTLLAELGLIYFCRFQTKIKYSDKQVKPLILSDVACPALGRSSTVLVCRFGLLLEMRDRQIVQLIN